MVFLLLCYFASNQKIFISSSSLHPMDCLEKWYSGALPAGILLRWHQHKVPLPQLHYHQYSCDICHLFIAHLHCEHSQSELCVLFNSMSLFRYFLRLIFLFQFLVTELVTRYDSHKKGREQESYEFGRLNIPRVFITLYNLLAVYFFGYVLQQTITNIGKFTIGRLRPHYLSVCRPNYTAFNCTDEYGLLRYVTESDLCTGDDQYRIDQAR